MVAYHIIVKQCCHDVDKEVRSILSPTHDTDCAWGLSASYPGVASCKICDVYLSDAPGCGSRTSRIYADIWYILQVVTHWLWIVFVLTNWKILSKCPYTFFLNHSLTIQIQLSLHAILHLRVTPTDVCDRSVCLLDYFLKVSLANR